MDGSAVRDIKYTRGWSALCLSGGQHKSVSSFQYEGAVTACLVVLKGSVLYLFFRFWQIKGMVNLLKTGGFFTYRQV